MITICCSSFTPSGPADLTHIAFDRHHHAGFQHAIIAVLWIVLGIENGGPFITHAVAGLATLAALKRPGFYKALHEKADEFCKACQGVLDRHGLTAIAAGEASFWQILFTKTAPTSYADVMASDVAAARTLDLASLKEGLVRPAQCQAICVRGAYE